MEQRARITQPDEVQARLTQLGPGLSIDLLLECVRASQAGRENTSPFHPPLHGPFNGYAEGTAALRAKLSEFGWTTLDADNYARALSPDQQVAIAVASGDENTGVDGTAAPHTRCPKGRKTAEAVLVNIQLTMFAGLGLPEEEKSQPGERAQTWLLLIRAESEELRSELSLPTNFENRSPDDYLQRLILPVIDLGGGPPQRRDGGGGGEDFDIDITRRVG